MSSIIGIRNFLRQLLNQAVAASAVLVPSTDLQFFLAANRVAHARFLCPFTLGATGGYKFQIIDAQASAAFLFTAMVTDATTPAFNAAVVQTATAPFANALAVAGNHFLQAELDITQGAVGGIVSLQFACNSAANSITLLAGSAMDLIFL
jgi:hypothetical protein